MRLVKKQEIILFLEEKKYVFSVLGDVQGSICGFSSISNYKEGTITWIKSLGNKNDVAERMAVCVVEEGVEVSAGTVITARNSKAVFFGILNRFFTDSVQPGISRDSVVETDSIGENSYIGHHCFIGKNVVIGDNVTIKNNVSIECPAVIGDGCVISSGVVIGAEGFGYFKDDEGSYRHASHFGGVCIGKNVDIGANTCIDRGTIDDTCIGDNVKIDNLCHIAHNASIGENSLVIALSMLGGSSRIERDVYIAPGSLIKNQVTVCSQSFVGMGTVVLDDVEERKVVAGVPARILRDNI